MLDENLVGVRPVGEPARRRHRLQDRQPRGIGVLARPIDLSAQQEIAVAPPPPGASLLKRTLIAAGALVVVGGIAALAIAFIALRGTGDVIDRMVPANSTVYVTVYLDPALKQKLNLRLANFV